MAWQSTSSRSSRVLYGLVAFFVLQILVCSQAWYAYRSDMLTVAEMQHANIVKGIPFVCHFGMWGDLFIISPLAAILIAKFSHLWKIKQQLWAAFMAVVVSVIMHCLYISGNVHEVHVNEHKLTLAGMNHCIYMAIALAVLLLFFLHTPAASSRIKAVTTACVVMHVFIGTHLLLMLIDLHTSLDWFPRESMSLIQAASTMTVVCIALVLRGWFRPESWSRPAN